MAAFKTLLGIRLQFNGPPFSPLCLFYEILTMLFCLSCKACDVALAKRPYPVAVTSLPLPSTRRFRRRSWSTTSSRPWLSAVQEALRRHRLPGEPAPRQAQGHDRSGVNSASSQPWQIRCERSLLPLLVVWARSAAQRILELLMRHNISWLVKCPSRCIALVV